MGADLLVSYVKSLRFLVGCIGQPRQQEINNSYRAC